MNLQHLGNSDTLARLAELRIDRRPGTVETRRRGPRLVFTLTAAVLALIGLLALLLLSGEITRAPAAAAPRAEPSPAPRAPPRPISSPPSGSREPGASVLDATGYVTARRQATVSARTTGQVSEVLIEEGATVAAGQVIARLDDGVARAELELAAARLDSARAALGSIAAELELADRTLERNETLAAKGLVSRATLDAAALDRDTRAAQLTAARRDVTVAERALEVQRRQLEDLTIRAPFDGVVVEKSAQPGEMVSPVSAGGGYTRTGIGTIVDMGSLEVTVDVNEAYIQRVHTGQPARIKLNAYPDRAYPARVLTVVPSADRNKATVPVRVAFLETDARVLPELGVRVQFLADDAASASQPQPAGGLAR